MAAGVQFRPKILGFLCNWCAYAGADLCGVSRYQYPPLIRVVRVMCSGRVDMEFVLRAFYNGMDGVFVGGCWPGECHYITEGNYDAVSMINMTKKLLEYIGINPERLRLAWVSASEGIRFAEIMNEFGERIRELGPLGKGEGIEDGVLKRKLKAAMKLVPYIRLVERQSLRVPVKSEEARNDYFASEQGNRIFGEMVLSRLAQTEIMMLLLEKGPLTGQQIAEVLGLEQAEVLEHTSGLIREGFVAYDVANRCFVPKAASAGREVATS